MREIPLFPINAVLFPGVPLHLHIFEDRYKLMVKHCLESDGMLGVVLIHQGLEALGPLPEPYLVGTMARIIEREELPDGCINITVLGVDRFHILARYSGTQPYLIGMVEASPVELPNMIQVHRQSRPLARSVRHYLIGLNQSHIENLNFSQIALPEDPMNLVFLAAALLQIPPNEKQPILEAGSISDMMDIVERLYRRENGLMPTFNTTEDNSARRAAWLN
ncbi:MAG TPA: LON peptidase substrate-binding domain-containing protein [Leptolinea sp.]